MTTDKRYLTCAETAKLVRRALKREFPSQKFSVRSKTYSGGASIDVRWTDGPTERDVNDVLRTFEGARFDGSVDLKYHAEHLLFPDGTVQPVRTYGHQYADQNTPGAVAEARTRIHPDAERVLLGADFVHGQRHYSEAFRAHLLGRIEDELGQVVEPEEIVPVSVWEDHGEARVAQVRDGRTGEYAREHASTLVYQLAYLTDARDLELEETS